MNQDAVVDLHPEELQLSGEEENVDNSRGDQDKGLKIRRTVTQVRAWNLSLPTVSDRSITKREELVSFFMPVIPHQVVQSDSQENGQTNEEEEEKSEKEKQPGSPTEKPQNSVCEEAVETQFSVKLEGETVKGNCVTEKFVGFEIAIEWFRIWSIFSLSPVISAITESFIGTA